MPTRLRDLELDEVSLVDVPANEQARVVLMKRVEKRKRCTVEKCPLEAGEISAAEECTMSECPMQVAKAPRGIKFVIGFKEEGGSEIQSVIFDQKYWTADKAREWLKAHDLHSGKLDTTDNTFRFRQHEPSEYVRFRTITPGKQVYKALRERNSWDVIQSAIRLAVTDKYQEEVNGAVQPTSWVYVRQFFDDSVIIEQDGTIYRVGYELSTTGDGSVQVTLKERVPVEVVYRDIEKADQGEELRLLCERTLKLIQNANTFFSR